MKTKFTLCLFLLSVYSFAQDSGFQLNDYKYRTPGYKALAVDFNFSGSYNSLKIDDDQDSRSRYLNLGPVNLRYARVISTETRLHQSTLSLQPEAAFSGSSYNGKEAHTGRFSPSFSWNRSDRFYRANKWFFEAGNQLSTGYHVQNIRDTVYRRKDNNFGVQDNLILGIGKGRIENVQDAQMALYLLQDLTAQNLLSRTPTADEARTLAQLITDINNKRVFDFRRRRIYELTRLDSFFRNSGLAPQTDIRHFTTINDNWALAFNPTRFAGSNWYLRLQPGVGYQYGKTSYTDPAVSSSKTAYTTLSLSPVFGYENDRPIKLRWQRNLSVSLAYSANRFRQNFEENYQGGSNKTSNTFNNWNSTVNASYGIGFYPNNRTLINGRFDVTGNYYKNRDFVFLSLLRFDAQYFISYRTYLTAAVYARHNYMNQHLNAGSSKSYDFSSGFAVSLSHVIF